MISKEFRDKILGLDVPLETRDNFKKSINKIRSYFSYEMLGNGELRQSEGYLHIIMNKVYLPLIRYEYLRSITQDNPDLVPTHVLEAIIEDMTGGELKFPEEIPEVNSAEWKRQISSLNVSKDKLNLEKRDMSTSRTSLDMMCGYILRIDKTLNDNTLQDILKYKMIKAA